MSTSIFRAIPIVWKNYTPQSHPSAMDGPRDRKASTENVSGAVEPEIQTLDEEKSPPPPPPSALSRFKVKLKVKPPSEKSTSTSLARTPSTAGAASVTKSSKRGSGDEGGSESEGEQWDQLEEDEPPSSMRSTPAKKTIPTSTPPTTTTGRGRGRGRGSGRGRGRGRGAAASSATVHEPPQTVFEVSPSRPAPLSENGTPTVLDAASMSEYSSSVPHPKRKRAKKGEGEPKRAVRKPRVSKVVQLQDDAASVVSESVNGTAPSSPLMREALSTPDMDPIPSLSLPEPEVPSLALDPTAPIPVYRLPHKPFLVHPPPKVPSGFAPTLPLDRGASARASVRRWRPAMRAVRGIAGGQWMMKTWVGEKESEYEGVKKTEPPAAAGTHTPGVGIMSYDHVTLQAYSVPPSGGFVNGRDRGSASASLVGSPSSLGNHPKLPGTGRGRGRGRGRGSRAASIDPFPASAPTGGTGLGIGVESASAVHLPSKMRETVSAQDDDMDVEPTVL